MFEIKVTIEIPALVEAARILSMRQTTQVEAKPEKIKEALAQTPIVAMPAVAPVVTPPTTTPVAVPVPPVGPPAGPSRAEVATAGAQLLSMQPALQGRLVALLGEFGAQTVQDIPEAQLGAFAVRLREMGARI